MASEPKCGATTVSATSSVFPGLFSGLLGSIGTIGTIAGLAEPLEAGVIEIAGASVSLITVAAVAGAAIALFHIAAFFVDRCNPADGPTECTAGAVESIVESFSSASEALFPFTGMHDRVDLVVKSKFWPIVEKDGGFVHCTDASLARRSEIMRCYFHSKEVCAAGSGSLMGGALAAAPAVLLGALAGAAIGCATIILCLFAIIVAAIVAAAVVLAAALAGGHIGRAIAGDSTPTAGGNPIEEGDYISTTGKLVRREDDDGANIFWWVVTANLHGQASPSLSRPFNHRDVEAEFAADACPIDLI